MPDIIETFGVLIFQNNKVLLVKHRKKAQHLNDTYGLPAGRPKNNETEIQTAIREPEEETGLITKEEYLMPLPNVYSALIERKDGARVFSIKAFL
jgi:8-oxo-dGTP pyrophosphatase MutT (NUDIX family)